MIKTKLKVKKYLMWYINIIKYFKYVKIVITQIQNKSECNFTN